MRVFTAEDVRRAAPMAEVIEAVRKAFVQVAGGAAIQPPRAHISVAPVDGTTLVMPGYLPQEPGMAVKIVSIFPGNPQLGFPVINAIVCVLDPQTGRPAALLDGTSLTALRTGAASGVGTDVLARPDARTGAVFGAGVQGRTQLLAISSVRDLTDVWVYDLDPKRTAAFINDMEGAVSARLHAASTPEEAAAADILCTVTTSGTPIFPDSAIRPGTHINAVGVFKTHMQEIPPRTVTRSRVFVESVEAAMEEAGDLVVPMNEGLIGKEHILAELGEVISGEKAGRTSADEVTLFKSVGVAAQDVATAALVLRRAEELGLGTEVEL